MPACHILLGSSEVFKIFWDRNPFLSVLNASYIKPLLDTSWPVLNLAGIYSCHLLVYDIFKVKCLFDLI